MAHFRRTLVLSALAAGLASSAALASAPAAPERAAPPRGEAVLLAQSGDVEIYYDEFGRRVIVDAYTGEIISVERPRRSRSRRGATSARSATISTIRRTWSGCAASGCASRAS